MQIYRSGRVCTCPRVTTRKWSGVSNEAELGHRVSGPTWTETELVKAGSPDLHGFTLAIPRAACLVDVRIHQQLHNRDCEYQRRLNGRLFTSSAFRQLNFCKGSRNRYLEGHSTIETDHAIGVWMAPSSRLFASSAFRWPRVQVTRLAKHVFVCRPLGRVK